MKNKACTLQFTGGRDSTRTTLILGEDLGFSDIHLLTFKTELTDDIPKVYTNIEKLRKYFAGRVNIHHTIIETHDLLRDLVQKKYLRNMLKFGTFNAATFCPSCRLSHHIHTIIYCQQHGITTASDGVNELTGYDLFQQPWAVAEIEKLYKKFGITYYTPLLNSPISSEQVLEEYNLSGKFTEPLFESQPKCLGGGQFHNLYLRSYYLPLKGKESYKDISMRWIEDKISFAIQHIENHSLV